MKKKNPPEHEKFNKIHIYIRAGNQCYSLIG